MIEARGVSKRYGDKLAADDLSFSMRPGRVAGFLGPNGARKSTTMRMILGLDGPTSASVTVNGVSYIRAATPARAVGALLDAKGVHRGGSGFSHMLGQAVAAGLPRRRGYEALTWSVCPRWRASVPAISQSVWGGGSVSPPRCSATRTC
jgi:ABC-2 type transport system ATP-binding protein